MRILHIRAGLAVKVQRALPAEVDVLVAVVVQVEIDHRAHADLTRHLVLVGQVRALLLDDLARLLDRLVQQILQIDDVALAGGQRAPLVADHTEGDVLHALVPVVPHQLDDLEELLEVQVLLIGHHVQALVEVIGVVAVERRRKVAGDVERRAVAAQDQRRGHAVGLQIDDLRPLRLNQQPLLAQLLDNRRHLVVVEALARVGIKRHAQQVVHALGVLERDLLEPREDLHGFLVAVLDLLEPRATLVLQLRVLLRLVVEADVQIDHRLHAALLDLLAVAPLLVGADHLAELRAPVAQMVDAHGRVAVEIIDALEAVADHRRGQVADVEALGDVDGGIIQTHRLALADLAGTPAPRMGEHRLHDIARQPAAAEEHVQIAADDLHVVDLLAGDLFGQLARDHLRRAAHHFGEAEARQRVIAHLFIRRGFNHRADVLAAETAVFKAALCRRGDVFRDLEFHIHGTNSPLSSVRVWIFFTVYVLL